MCPVRPRFIRSRRDIVLVLLVLVLPVVVLIGAYRLVGGGSAPGSVAGIGVPAVDSTSAYQLARAANLFPVSEPNALPQGWRPVSSAFQEGNAGGVLRIGLRGPSGGAVQIVESNVIAYALVSGELGDEAKVEDTVSLLGRDWQQYTADDNEQALVLRQPDRTTIVSGRVSVDDLAALAAALG
jgi:hypothetical protein